MTGWCPAEDNVTSTGSQDCVVGKDCPFVMVRQATALQGMLPISVQSVQEGRA